MTDDIRYSFDQAAYVLAIETASALFELPHLRLSIKLHADAVHEPSANI